MQQHLNVKYMYSSTCKCYENDDARSTSIFIGDDDGQFDSRLSAAARPLKPTSSSYCVLLLGRLRMRVGRGLGRQFGLFGGRAARPARAQRAMQPLRRQLHQQRQRQRAQVRHQRHAEPLEYLQQGTPHRRGLYYAAVGLPDKCCRSAMYRIRYDLLVLQ